MQFSEDSCWYRGIIKRLRIPNKEDSPKADPQFPGSEFEYEVLHIDFGSIEWVKHSQVRPVVDKFFDLPIETLPCCLADIEPMGWLYLSRFNCSHLRDIAKLEDLRLFIRFPAYSPRACPFMLLCACLRVCYSTLFMPA